MEVIEDDEDDSGSDDEGTSRSMSHMFQMIQFILLPCLLLHLQFPKLSSFHELSNINFRVFNLLPLLAIAFSYLLVYIYVILSHKAFHASELIISS